MIGGIMRKVDLNMNEDYKYNIIKKLVDSNGNKNNAAIKLKCSKRNVNRLIIKYNLEGKSGFVHGNRNRTPINTTDNNKKDKVVELYKNKYFDANFTHFKELLEENENICLSITTITNILKEKNILSPKAQRKTKRRLKKKLKIQKKNSKTKKENLIINERIMEIDRHEAHPRRPRCAYFGEVVQMDASQHRWFDGVMTHLHLAIDDATGKVLAGYFDVQKTLKAYYNVLHNVLNDYGIPARFLTDNRTVFEYKRKNAPSDVEDTFTQFKYACHQLGIDIDTTSVPQAKGRIERLNQTFQSRLVIELRLNDIHSIESANKYIKDFIKKYNKKFELPINKTKTVFEKAPSKKQINTTLAVISKRKIDHGNCLKFKNKYYTPANKDDKPVYFNQGSEALVIEAFNGLLYVNLYDNIYILKEVVNRLEKSKEFDEVEKKKKVKKYIPPMSHPWKKASYDAFIAKQKHRARHGAHV